MQISLNLAEIEALPKCIRNKSSEILNFFSAEIPSLVSLLVMVGGWVGGGEVRIRQNSTLVEIEV